MMKRIYLLLLLTLIMVSCGTDGSHFKIEGRLLNLNQGEFYIYSTDGLISGMDTIKVRAGRFVYETPCEGKGTLVIVFPNFSEQPVFAKSGKTVQIKGDASHLKELEITGTKENKLMGKFREMSKNASPAEIKHYAELFVSDHPNSPVSDYLVHKYFLNTPSPDYNGAVKLYKIMVKAQPENGRLVQNLKKAETIAKSGVGKPVPTFTATDINGKKITNADLGKGKAVIFVWASWEYESCGVQRILQEQINKPDGNLKAIGICLDTSLKDCRNVVERDEITLPVICEQLMYDSKIIKKFGLTSIPDNIIIDNGKITARNITTEELREMLQ
jgi:peroxiredoxin